MVITTRQIGKVTVYVASATNQNDWLTDFNIAEDSILAYRSARKYQSKSLIALERLYDITDEQNNEFLAQKAEAEAALKEETDLDDEIMP